MKKIISSALYTALVVIALSSCQKGEVVQDVNSLSIGSYVTLVSAGNNIIDATNLAGTKVSASVKEYGSPQEKLIVYVTKAPVTTNKANWKKVKEYTNSGGTYNLEVSGQEISNALGKAPGPGETYILYNQVVTKDGRVFDVSNTLPDLANVGTYNLKLTWNAVVVCPFVPDQATGTYVITRDPWDGPYGSLGADVDVVASAGKAVFTYMFPVAEAPGKNPVTVTVNPATGSATVARQTYGSYGGAYDNMTCEGTGFYFSCTGSVDLTLLHKFSNGSNEGTYGISLKKK
ncbi:MAG: hypothetical protein RL131_324 [Bacteroidota bacterium]|jgi:hypothetical protein